MGGMGARRIEGPADPLSRIAGALHLDHQHHITDQDEVRCVGGRRQLRERGGALGEQLAHLDAEASAEDPAEDIGRVAEQLKGHLMLSRGHERPIASREPIVSERNVGEFDRLLAALAAVRRRTATRPRVFGDRRATWVSAHALLPVAGLACGVRERDDDVLAA